MGERPAIFGAAARAGLTTALADAVWRPGAGLLPHVATRLFNEPLAIEPMKLRTILASLGPRFGLAGVRAEAPPTLVRQDRSSDYEVRSGIALINVMGSIVKRNEGGMLADSGLVSMEALRETIASALGDPGVRDLLLHVDSYGGEAIGTADLARYIFQSRGEKRIWVVADDAAYSAAYYIGAAADRVLVTSTGGVGSIGVITLHVDESAANEAAGMKVTPIFAGEQKVDGWDFAPLSDRARLRFQSRVNDVWDRFLADVGEFRKLPISKVRDFQAGTFYGQDAVDVGLADSVATFDEAFTELATRAAPARPNKGVRMADKPTPVAADGLPADVIAMADHRKAIDQSTVEGRLAGQKEERERVAGIDQIAAISRLPKADANKLRDALVTKGSSVKEASAAFIDAQATADAKVELLGQTAATQAASPHPVPALQPREAVLASRHRSMRSREQSIAAAASLVTKYTDPDQVKALGGVR
jgi:signal peptide peptidase SppA